ncbi:MAG: metallophosphoesterase family protein [Acidobacteria bacterium]|nr:metallophosphoesterase family protein [Acidobacteriota bacterium]
MKLAVLSDIHGNRWALEAVLDDVRRRNVTTMINLGDCLYGPLDPRGTADVLLALDIPTVRGNEDRLLVAPDALPSPTLTYTREQLDEVHLNWLRDLPLCRRDERGRLAFHASPDTDDRYLLWDVAPSGAVARDAAAVRTVLGDEADAELVLCGHDHVPAVRQPADGILLVNPGSVGLPAYDDDLPHPHRMAAGSPHARYAVVTGTPIGRRVELVAVPYDWVAAARTAEQNGRPDWARWLRTGEA